MPGSVPVGEQAARPSEDHASGIGGRVWKNVKLVLSRTFFWTYHRGSWQYDVLCIIILLFIFLPPRPFFRDLPRLELTDLRHTQGLVELGHTKETHTYQVDSRLVESLGPRPLEEAMQEILGRRLDHPFTIKAIEPFLDKNKVRLGYTVVVSP